MKGGWIYIMTNAPFGTLYIGVTADLARRVRQHRNDEAHPAWDDLWDHINS